MLNAAAGGVTRRQTSNDNRLEIAGLSWEHEQVIFAEKQGQATDGILGFNVFEDRIVEIDYERNLLKIRDSLPATMDGYSRNELRFHGTSPFVEATLGIGTTGAEGLVPPRHWVQRQPEPHARLLGTECPRRRH